MSAGENHFDKLKTTAAGGLGDDGEHAARQERPQGDGSGVWPLAVHDQLGNDPELRGQGLRKACPDIKLDVD